MALPHDAHPMGTILTGLAALSTCHPEQNPALAGQHIYKSTEVQDKQIVRLIGKIPTLAAFAYHRASGRKPAPPNQKLGYAEVSRDECTHAPPQPSQTARAVPRHQRPAAADRAELPVHAGRRQPRRLPP